MNGSKLVYLTDELNRELEYWRFINSWMAFVGVEVTAILRLYCPSTHVCTSMKRWLSRIRKGLMLVIFGKRIQVIKDLFIKIEADAVYKELLVLGEDIANF